MFWKSYHFNEKQRFAPNQNINVVETRLKNRRVRSAFRSADTPGDTARRLVKTSELGAKAGALVAIFVSLPVALTLQAGGTFGGRFRKLSIDGVPTADHPDFSTFRVSPG